jgi:hypothetical protein
MTYIIQKFVPWSKDMRAHWADVCCTRDADKARAIIAGLERGRVLVNGMEVEL